MRWNPWKQNDDEREAARQGARETGDLKNQTTQQYAGSIESRIADIGSKLLLGMTQHEQSVFDSGFWSGKLMAWSTQDETFKTQLFRLVDVFPVLHDRDAIAKHVNEYLRAPGVKLPAGMGTGLAAGAFVPGAMAKTMTRQIEQMAGTFIAGRDVASAMEALEKRWQQGMAYSLDLLGEACVSDKEAKVYQTRYLALIDEMAEAAAGWPVNETLERDHLGAIPRVNVSVKVTSLAAKVDPLSPEASMERVLENLGPILQRAGEKGVFINFDMEQFALKDFTIELFKQAVLKWDFHAGIALQAYLKSGPADAKNLIDWSRDAGRVITVRLVKGAYWDYEVAHAQSQGWPVPVWMDKHQTDACFEAMTKQFIDACPRNNEAHKGGIKLALGSHNVRSVAAGLAMLEEAKLPPQAIELQMLRGMADSFKAAAVEQGLRVREYVPISELVPGMAYLVRRLLENTSNQSWLLGRSHDQKNIETLLASPHHFSEVGNVGEVFDAQAKTKDASANSSELSPSTALHPLSESYETLGDGHAFANEPLRDFSDAKQREAFGNAAASSRIKTIVSDATVEQAKAAVGKAATAFDSWSTRPAMERAQLMIRTAELMRERRDELAGMVIRESSKTWAGADADICEAIDFLEYYARQATAMFEGRQLGDYLAEENRLSVRPRGVSVVISPWNFPLAICTGMTAASLVTGNTTIVKPAEQSPFIAKVMVDLFHEAGVPKHVVQLVAGQGEVAGAALAADERVANIAFTGSRAVGLELMRVAANVKEGQRQSKRLICEMGGKNAIIVDESADPDLAVLAVRESAFGYAGQKCSACSRLILVGKENDPRLTRFIERLIEATRALVIGDPLEPDTDIGPVIDEEAAAKIRSYIELGLKEGRLVYAGVVPDGLASRTGHSFVPPHIFTGIRAEHRLAQEEIFGPVLSVMLADSFEDAVALANDSAYRLTGGVISRTPSHLAYARAHFAAGNLYLNRGCTGALVGRQPFGGFGMSGIGEKAGGPFYLRQFVDSTHCTEHTLRSGFSPQVFEMLKKGARG